MRSTGGMSVRQGLGDVGLDQVEARLAAQVRHVVAPAGGEVVDRPDLVPGGQRARRRDASR